MPSLAAGGDYHTPLPHLVPERERTRSDVPARRVELPPSPKRACVLPSRPSSGGVHDSRGGVYEAVSRGAHSDDGNSGRCPVAGSANPRYPAHSRRQAESHRAGPTRARREAGLVRGVGSGERRRPSQSRQPAVVGARPLPPASAGVLQGPSDVSMPAERAGGRAVWAAGSASCRRRPPSRF